MIDPNILRIVKRYKNDYLSFIKDKGLHLIDLCDAPTQLQILLEKVRANMLQVDRERLTFTISYLDGYGQLVKVLTDSLNRAQFGKGYERHGTAEDFENQTLFAIRKFFGPGFTLGQAVKKIEESTRLGDAGAINELLDAIVYIAAEVIAIEARMAANSETPVDNPNKLGGQSGS